MKTLIILIMASMISSGGMILYDFNSAKTSGQWYIVNDGVMGGISKSKISINLDGTATFSGTVSPENNGGFASIRTNIESDLDNKFKGVVIRIKGDGKIYNLRFRSSNSFDGYSYQAKVQTANGEWKEFKVPFDDFSPTMRGYTLKNKPPLEAENIKQMGILISDKQWGDFSADIDWISLYE